MHFYRYFFGWEEPPPNPNGKTSGSLILTSQIWRTYPVPDGFSDPFSWFSGLISEFHPLKVFSTFRRELQEILPDLAAYGVLQARMREVGMSSQGRGRSMDFLGSGLFKLGKTTLVVKKTKRPSFCKHFFWEDHLVATKQTEFLDVKSFLGRPLFGGN